MVEKPVHVFLHKKAPYMGILLTAPHHYEVKVEKAVYVFLHKKAPFMGILLTAPHRSRSIVDWIHAW